MDEKEMQHHISKTLGSKMTGINCAACEQKDEEIAALRKDLARISEELGLPPLMGPADGWLRNAMARWAECEKQLTATKRKMERLSELLCECAELILGQGPDTEERIEMSSRIRAAQEEKP